jgi:hypothetical protein
MKTINDIHDILKVYKKTCTNASSSSPTAQICSSDTLPIYLQISKHILLCNLAVHQVDTNIRGTHK